MSINFSTPKYSYSFKTQILNGQTKSGHWDWTLRNIQSIAKLFSMCQNKVWKTDLSLQKNPAYRHCPVFEVRYLDVNCATINFQVTLNSSVNFIIYCIFGEKFKKIFFRIFCPFLLKGRDQVWKNTINCTSILG
jgi:hypothetical protein